MSVSGATTQASGFIVSDWFAICGQDDRAAKLVLYKGKPVMYQGQLLYEHEYSDHLMIKLLEATIPAPHGRPRGVFARASRALESNLNGGGSNRMEDAIAFVDQCAADRSNALQG
jgi:hypothetical protein